jgi:hypothetical protein
MIRPRFCGWTFLALATSSCAASPEHFAATDPHSPLVLKQTIPLPDVAGRIDHLAVDVKGHRLFVAEVANGSVDRIDLATGKADGRINGLKAPQGIGWLPAQKEIVVACGDGTVRFYVADTLRPTAIVVLGDDADNVRVDPRNGHVVVGYGAGGLAIIDPATHRLIGRVIFKGHPEGFRLSGSRALINVPDDGAILSVDLDQGKVLARWSTGAHRLNFPLAMAPGGSWFMVGYRLPAALARVDANTGQVLAMQGTCGDTDDLFLQGDRTLVVCGAGHVDIVRGDRTEARVKRAAVRGPVFTCPSCAPCLSPCPRAADPPPFGSSRSEPSSEAGVRVLPGMHFGTTLSCCTAVTMIGSRRPVGE